MGECEQKKDICFVITPIGNDGDPIRRHIDGIIDAVIKPVLGEKLNYDVIAAHNICEPGTITKQVIKHIFEDKLVITNLTDINPNVMYELAVRQCLGKPVITIAQKGTNLPSDIIMQRTIFYQNDAKGTLELRAELAKYVNGIDFTEVSSPIHDIIHEINRDAKIIELSEAEHGSSGADQTLPYILNRLTKIEDMLLFTRNAQIHSISHSDINNNVSSYLPEKKAICFEYEAIPESLSEPELADSLLTDSPSYCNIENFRINRLEQSIEIGSSDYSVENLNNLVSYVKNVLTQYGFKGVKLSRMV